ncbi:MAG: DUF2459 domain-containing protein [Acidobacteria bacterium]|nr:DUF2459 domain-containing protein [Acidobacteriota bacterium]
MPAARRRTPGRRRWLWWLAPLPVALLLAAAPIACSTTVVAPAALSDPVPIFVVDYGTTSAVVLPYGDDLLAFVYGDWQYYALTNNHLLNGVAALVWPTQGTLGRGRLRGPPAREQVLAQLRGRGVEDVHVVRVERADVERLVQRLDELYEAHRATEVANADYGMSFVHHPRRYTWFWNSNHQTAAWLEAVGCEVRGPAFASRWRIEEADR